MTTSIYKITVTSKSGEKLDDVYKAGKEPADALVAARADLTANGQEDSVTEVHAQCLVEDAGEVFPDLHPDTLQALVATYQAGIDAAKEAEKSAGVSDAPAE